MLLSSCVATLAQENDLVRFNTTKNTNEEFTSSTAKYPQFVKGKALLKNGSEAQGVFNYNYGTHEILFINSANDTLALDAPAQYKHIVIGTDTFSYSKRGFVQLVKSAPYYSLYVKRSLDRINSEKKAAYGGYSSTSASTPLRSISDGATQRNITTDENFVYRLVDTYLFADRFGNFYPATKKGIRELAWKKENEVKDFVEKAGIDFEKKKDLEKLLAFVQSVGQE